MALWYHCGNGWTAARWARADLGADVYLCGSGPGLAGVNEALLQSPGVSM